MINIGYNYELTIKILDKLNIKYEVFAQCIFLHVLYFSLNLDTIFQKNANLIKMICIFVKAVKITEFALKK